MDKETQQLFWIYHDAKRRCNNPKHKRYPDYGGRGIKFLFNSFDHFLDTMGPRPPNYEIDRRDNDGHYEPSNLRWVDFSTQQKNKRLYKNNTSGVKGVNYITSIGKWVARCNEQSNGKRRYLYVGKSFHEACSARWKWEDNQSTQ
jgi:hypothetical protein